MKTQKRSILTETLKQNSPNFTFYPMISEDSTQITMSNGFQRGFNRFWNTARRNSEKEMKPLVLLTF